jgi:phosphocarrier protein HPr
VPELTLVIHSSNGLHARPATELVNKASSFKSEITVSKDGKQAKSIINVMTLAIGPGEEIQVKADGPDEKEAIENIGERE